MFKKALISGVALCALGLSANAYAQRAGDNAVTSAQDAFGTTVGNETIGLYGIMNARGFSPVQAGNVRLEGLYFDRQSNQNPFTRWIAGSAVHVGLSAQSYPFPAPTGIADFKLRIPGEEQVTSVYLAAGPFDEYNAEIDTQIPVTDKFSIGGGVGYWNVAWDWGSHSLNWSTALLARWKPNDKIEIVPFWSKMGINDWEVRPFVYMAGPFLPPKYPRLTYYSQDWADWEENNANFGVLARMAAFDNWTLRAGIFRSLSYLSENSLIFYNNTQTDGSADLQFILNPPQRFGSYSGEVRASGVYAEGPRRHTAHIAFKGRRTDRLYSGAAIVQAGPAQIGVTDRRPKPVVNFGPRSADEVRQWTPGIAYEGLWPNVGELSLGIQKSFYTKSVQQPARPLATTKSNPWLYNGTLAIYATDQFAFYTSYTRGLEEAGTAPERASNRGETLPANITKQVDGGFRYAITPSVKLVAGVFEVKKPYIEVDPNSVFGNVGNVRHRGIELSVAGQPMEGLTVVAGAVFLEARLSGALVDNGSVGRIPFARDPITARLNLQYGPPSWGGFTAETQLEYTKQGYADPLNLLRLPSRTILNVGGRYRLDLYGAPATVRAQVLNVTNTYGMTLGGGSSAWFNYATPRRFTISLTTDF